MPKFIFAYHGGKAPDSPEEGQKAMKAWTDWFTGLGAAIVDGGHPAGMSKTVLNGSVADNGGANPISGYSLVNAADLNAAVEMAKGCPMVTTGEGNVEVAECLDM